MIQVREAIIVEGKYDKIKLSSMIDGLIIETGGFRIFNNKEKMALIRRLAETRGILILTDSDSAGFLIRNHLNGAIPKGRVKHAYIPDIFGKERRKEKPSQEGKLGVEGIPQEILIKAIRQAGVDCGVLEGNNKRFREVTKLDLFELGFSGGEDSRKKRAALLKTLNLPEHLSPNALLPVVNCLMSYEEFCQAVKNLKY
ncbi:MAG: DUF4093 domain-containing protein [Clostridiales bacterium]|jgi:ribonuclease M5|nr:DUF4093 domain-containing protein [Clostridiales bacterium]